MRNNTVMMLKAFLNDGCTPEDVKNMMIASLPHQSRQVYACIEDDINTTNAIAKQLGITQSHAGTVLKYLYDADLITRCAVNGIYVYEVK